MADPTIENPCRKCKRELADQPEIEAGICRACAQVEDEESGGMFQLEPPLSDDEPKEKK